MHKRRPLRNESTDQGRDHDRQVELPDHGLHPYQGLGGHRGRQDIAMPQGGQRDEGEIGQEILPIPAGMQFSRPGVDDRPWLEILEQRVEHRPENAQKEEHATRASDLIRRCLLATQDCPEENHDDKDHQGEGTSVCHNPGESTLLREREGLRHKSWGKQYERNVEVPLDVTQRPDARQHDHDKDESVELFRLERSQDGGSRQQQHQGHQEREEAALPGLRQGAEHSQRIAHPAGPSAWHFATRTDLRQAQGMLQDGPPSPDADPRLLSGERSLLGDLARTARIVAELWKGFHSFRKLRPCVTVFGSARFKDGDPYYEMTRELGRQLGRAGFGVMTGAGPGAMEAANRGARDVGAQSVGCTIHLPMEQATNPYVDQVVEFHHFFVRKVMLVRYSAAFVLVPGGFGTMDEAFETLTLIQTGKIRNFPVVALGDDYWEHLRPFLNDTMVANSTIDPTDVDLLYPAKDPADAVRHILSITGSPKDLRIND